MECNAIDYGNEEQGPVCTAFGLTNITAVIDGEEDMGSFCEVRECFAEGAGIRGLEEHERHAWAEEDDV